MYQNLTVISMIFGMHNIKIIKWSVGLMIFIIIIKLLYMLFPLHVKIYIFYIQRANALVTTDSGPRHIATAMDVPVVSLFGPIDPRWTETYHPKSTNFFRALPCSPCGGRDCPLGHHRCMRDLSVDDVHQALQRLMEDRTYHRIGVAA